MNPTRPLILITNDDGIHSPGLHAAIGALAGLGDLLVVAPTEQQSGMGRGLPAAFDGRIFPHRLTHNGLVIDAYHLDGSPAQAVLYGVLELASRRPDLVVSGINYGENLGTSTTVSGTVGAALQGGDMGIRALAVSMETKKDYHFNLGSDVDWSCAARWLHFFAGAALARTIWPDDVAVLKIDLPDTVTSETPWRLTTQSRQPYYRSHSTRTSLAEARRLDYEVAIDHERLEADSDIHAFAIERVISVTPLSVDLTARVAMTQFDALLRRHTAS